MVPESRVQICFQIWRSRFHVQRKRETDQSLEQNQEQNLWDKYSVYWHLKWPKFTKNSIYLELACGGHRDKFSVLDITNLSYKSLSHSSLELTFLLEVIRGDKQDVRR
jgi:hypothetical protein